MQDDFKETPLYDALRARANAGETRMHMPGHKGFPVFPTFAEVFAIDYTETYGTGNLYEPGAEDEPIRAAERLTASYYGATDCHFITGGSTQGIHAMLCVCAAGGDILLDRTCHKSVLSACALFDINPYFVCPPVHELYGFSLRLDVGRVEAMLIANPNIRTFMTVSPTYYGVLQDIPALANVCHAHGVRLLVDAAHGAHLVAVRLGSPLAQGADMAVMSAHKTLPALGQGAYLLFQEAEMGDDLRRAEAMVGTSSPSYPVMASLDLARSWIAGKGRSNYRACSIILPEMCEELHRWVPFRAIFSAEIGPMDSCRLVIYCAGMDGRSVARELYTQCGLACEMADARNLVCIITGADTPKSVADILRAFKSCSFDGLAISQPPPIPIFPAPERVLSVRHAWFAPCKSVPLAQAAGEICARAITPYPPGIPLLWPGEKIGPVHIEILRKGCYTKCEEIQVISK